MWKLFIIILSNMGEKKIKKIYNVFIGRLTEDKDPEFFLNNCIELSKKNKF